MNISIFRTIPNCLANGNTNIFGANAWPSGSVIQDDFGYFDSVNDSILLPAGYHDIGVFACSKDGVPIEGSVESTAFSARGR